ncbi:MAG TPA: ArsA family ATPase [Thermobifida alba]|nr:ArsA family ATPase [Thermobifida alba]
MLLTGAAVTFVGGKGGVGKTTLAAAHALALADRGQRTLLVSVDPAHSLGDVLQARLGDRPRRVADRLWAVEPDAGATVRRRVARIADDARTVVPDEVMPAVRRHLRHAAAAPGMAESALNDRLVDYLEQVPGTWDRLVVDSAPTGHLLRMLALPTLLTPWIQGLAHQRERAVAADRPAAALFDAADRTADPMLEKLHARRRRLEAAAARLRSDAVVCLVTLPREAVVAETRRAARALEAEGFTLGVGAVNQVPARPAPATMERIRALFAAPGLVEVPLLAEEPLGPEALRTLPPLLVPEPDRGR